MQEAIMTLLPSTDPAKVLVRKSIKRLSPDKSKWWFTIMAQDETLTALDNAWASSEFNLNWKLQHSLRRPELSDSTDADHTNGATYGEAVAPVEDEGPRQGNAEPSSGTVTLVPGDHELLPPSTTSDDDVPLQPPLQSMQSQNDDPSICTIPVPSSAKRLEPGCTLDLDSTERQSAARECG